jgi:integrase
MAAPRKSASLSGAERRAVELDTIASVLPIDRRDELAELLTDRDIETLRHLVNQGMGANTLRALTSDLAYLEAWGAGGNRKVPALAGARGAAAEIRRPSPVGSGQACGRSGSRHAGRGRREPARPGLSEICRPARAGHRAPAAGELVDADEMAWPRWRLRLPCPEIRHSSGRARVPRTRRRKSAQAVTSDVLAELLATCATDSLRDLRDRAILMVAFASGGRRRSEIAGLRVEQLSVETPIEVADGPPLPSLAIHLGRTKTTTGEQDEVVYLTGRPVEALNAWLVAAKIDKGSVFRGIGRWGTVSKRALDPQSINAIFKQRAEMAGLDAGEFSAHGLRSGYLTEAANRGISLPEAMEQSRHRSVQQASSYYNNATRRSGRASRML